MRRILLGALLFAVPVAACGGDPATTTTVDLTTIAATAPTGSSQGDATAHTPDRAVPAGFPVFPGAVLGNDFSGGPDAHNYLYSTSGSAEEIVAFFADAFRGLGLDVTEEFAVNEEFGVAVHLPIADGVGARVAAVYFIDDGVANATPSTPGRGYAVMIDFTAWSAR